MSGPPKNPSKLLLGVLTQGRTGCGKQNSSAEQRPRVEVLIDQPLSSFSFNYKWQRTQAVDYLQAESINPKRRTKHERSRAAEGMISYMHARNEARKMDYRSSNRMKI